MPLQAGRSSCWTGECNLGNMVTDAFVFYYANMSASPKQWTEASIAIQNSGSITAPIDLIAQGNFMPTNVLSEGLVRLLTLSLSLSLSLSLQALLLSDRY